MPERGARKLPSVQRPAQHRIADFDRQLINVLRGEVVAHVVIAGAVLAAQLTGKRRKNSAGGERKESAVGDRIHAAAPSVVDLDLQAVPQPLVGR